LPLPRLDAKGRPWAVERGSLILSTLVQPLLPLELLAAMFLLLRGHNLPGGGFVAGLVTSVGLLLHYVANGTKWVRQRYAPDYCRLLAFGLLIASVTGVGSWAFDHPFLTSTHGHFQLPFIGDLALASTLAFDIGVYLTVVGSVLLILAELGGLGDRSRLAEQE
jgi:multicomponent K+:H+ antiporter subunit A